MEYPAKKCTGQTTPGGYGNCLNTAVFLVLVLISLFAAPGTAGPAENPAMNETTSSGLTIIVKDAATGAGISGVMIYIDNNFEGITAGDDGVFDLSSVAPGEHTLRAAKTGFLESGIRVQAPDEKPVIVRLKDSKIIPVGDHGPVEDRIDIVFVPSKTQYDCNKVMKITTGYYTDNEENFITDINRLIQKKFFTLDSLVTESAGLPDTYRKKFNFYYYWDPGNFADAFQDCAGTLPTGFWDDAPFTDLAIIIYPTYGGYYKGPPCEPSGCASGMGPGVKTWFKNPADSGLIFMHETGHVVFGLIDTYCGPTYYTQNNPDPNVWSSVSACMADARANNRDPARCRQIELLSKNTVTCSKNFWRWDPEPDIMSSLSLSGKFGDASSLQIRYILTNINRWKL